MDNPELSFLFVLSGGISALISWILIRRGGIALDLPNLRSSHSIPTPRGGGIAFFIAITAIIAFSYRIDGEFASEVQPIFFLCWVLIFLLGFCEDRYQLGAKVRLICQILLAAIIAGSGYFWNVCDQFGLIFSHSEWFSKLATVFLIVWATNLYNFMDGINGIATLQGIAVATLYIALGTSLNSTLLAIFGTIILGSLIGFLPFNFPKAKIFMGDSGSLFLGFLLVTLPLTTKTTREYNFTFAIISIGPFFFDALITILRRIISRDNILQPHRSHFYQKLQMLISSHAAVSLIYFMFAILFGAVSYLRIRSKDNYSDGALSLILILMLAFLWIHLAYRSRTKSNENGN